MSSMDEQRAKTAAVQAQSAADRGDFAEAFRHLAEGFEAITAALRKLRTQR